MKRWIHGIVGVMLSIVVSGAWGCGPKVFLCEDGSCPANSVCAKSPVGNDVCYRKCGEKGASEICWSESNNQTDCVCIFRIGIHNGLIFYPCPEYKAEECNGKDDDCDGLVDNAEEGKSLCPKGQECNAGKCECPGNNQTFCGNECVVTANDRKHCGGCGNECKPGELCGNGKCAVDCPVGQTVCDGTCVVLASDLQHCGGCGKACPQGQECKAGKCECPTNKPTLCGNECVVTSNDPKHCGGCGNFCKQGEVCGGGKCLTSCPTNQTVCSGKCVSLESDAVNCGECGKKCLRGAECVKGRCSVLIQAGKFQMGSPSSDTEAGPDEKPQREVTLTRDYWMDTTEVTQSDFQELMGYNPSNFSGCGSCPVEKVSWHEALAYANVRSKRDGLEECFDCNGSKESVSCELKKTFATPYDCKGWRLPTEAEWEYAARAGITEPRYGNLDEIAWYEGNSNQKTHPVGQKKPNVWGLYDILGNVWEWCYDWYQDSYSGLPTQDPVGPSNGTHRVIRGGSWGVSARNVRAAGRGGGRPVDRGSNIGFRLVRADYQ